MQSTKSQKIKYGNETPPVDVTAEAFWDQIANSQKLRHTKQVVVYGTATT